MKRHVRFLALICCILLVFTSLAGCGDNAADPAVEPADPNSAEETDVEPTPAEKPMSQHPCLKRDSRALLPKTRLTKVRSHI